MATSSEKAWIEGKKKICPLAKKERQQASLFCLVIDEEVPANWKIALKK